MKLLIIIAKFIEKYWLAFAMFFATLWGVMLLAVMFSWLFGYWYNGLSSGKFDLSSCWQGVTAGLTGLGTVLSAGIMGYMRFRTNSQLNTMPYSNTPVPRAGINTERPL